MKQRKKKMEQNEGEQKKREAHNIGIERSREVKQIIGEFSSQYSQYPNLSKIQNLQVRRTGKNLFW